MDKGLGPERTLSQMEVIVNLSDPSVSYRRVLTSSMSTRHK